MDSKEAGKIMKEFVRGERAKLSDMAAINHIWEVGVSIDAPFFIVDFCCLGLDEAGQIVDDRYLISYNQPDAPNSAIRMDNASNNGAFFTLYLEQLPPAVRRVVFTATVHKPEMPGGLLGAAFSLFAPNLDIGEGHLMLGTPAVAAGVFAFSGEDFGEESTLILSEFYWRDEWRFVAAGQPLKGELDVFLRTLTDGPMPVPVSTPIPQPASTPLAAPPRPARAVPPPTPQVSPPLTPAPRTIPPKSVPNQPVLTPTRVSAAPTPPLSQPVAQSIAPQPQNPAIVTPTVVPTISVFPHSLPPGGKLQDLIDAAPPNSTLTLMCGEYQGPIRINKPLTIEGRESALWARSGPVVTITTAEVTLRNFDIEVTIAQDATDETGVALRIETNGPQLHLNNVRLRGRISGLGLEDGNWLVPSKLDLGQFAPRADNDFYFTLRVPTDVTLSLPVEGISLSPEILGAGQHQVKLIVHDILPEVLLFGHLEIRSSSIVQTIPLTGSAITGTTPKRDSSLDQ